MGVSPEPAFYDHIRDLALSIPGCRNVHNVNAEQIGGQIRLGMHVEVGRGITIEEADAIADAVHDAICEAYDDIWVVVHADPERGDGATPAQAAAPS